MKEIVLKVNGMMCTGCENRVQNVVSKIENVISVKANHENGTVKVQADGEVDLNEIKSAIRDLDFEVID